MFVHSAYWIIGLEAQSWTQTGAAILLRVSGYCEGVCYSFNTSRFNGIIQLVLMYIQDDLHELPLD